MRILEGASEIWDLFFLGVKVLHTHIFRAIFRSFDRDIYF